WVYGECTRAFASRFRDENNTVGEHVAPVQIAAEWLLADLQVHRDLKFALEPRIAAYGLLGSGPGPSEEDTADRLPLAETIQSIGSAPPVVATPLVPRYPEMVERVYQRFGWNPTDFHGFRFVMKYPPMPVAIVYQHDLDGK
ncbi:MAG: hypothetical protein KDA21_07885, partial [Phycisphaerales bacterium]|nr:hypothetical protein [Phycisphaerales bacterium]